VEARTGSRDRNPLQIFEKYPFATFGTGLWSETKKNLAPLQVVKGKMK
jgi:hypothetical protein